MEDDSLIAASQQGQTEAFNELVIRYQNMVYTLCYRVLGEREVAEDAAQETFISAYEAIGRFRGGSFRGWLLRIATNACYDILRTRKRRPSTPLSQLQEEGSEPFPVPSDAPGPEEEAVNQELWESIQKGLMTLPIDQRAVVVLCDVQGMSYEEAAKAMRCSVGTVKSRLSRGRAHLRDYLRDLVELLPSKYRLNYG